MASHMAGRWAEGNTQLRIPITPAYTFAWVVPKCKIGDVDIQQVPGTATMVAHRVHWTCFGAISPKLAFLDVDPATAAGKHREVGGDITCSLSRFGGRDERAPVLVLLILRCRLVSLV